MRAAKRTWDLSVAAGRPGDKSGNTIQASRSKLQCDGTQRSRSVKVLIDARVRDVSP